LIFDFIFIYPFHFNLIYAGTPLAVLLKYNTKISDKNQGRNKIFLFIDILHIFYDIII